MLMLKGTALGASRYAKVYRASTPTGEYKFPPSYQAGRDDEGKEEEKIAGPPGLMIVFGFALLSFPVAQHQEFSLSSATSPTPLTTPRYPPTTLAFPSPVRDTSRSSELQSTGSR